MSGQTENELLPLHLTVWIGHTRETLHALNDLGGGVWEFPHVPVSTQNLIVIGTLAGVSRVLVNYDLEPIQGTLTMSTDYPAFDSVVASFYHYVASAKVLTKDFQVEYTAPGFEQNIYGKPVYVLSMQFPTKLTFNVILSAENQRNLLTESVENGYFFLVIDNNTVATYGIRAWEGPIFSNDISSFFKGKPYLLPITLNVAQHGFYDDTADEITWR
jgi:hypothetical protein